MCRGMLRTVSQTARNEGGAAPTGNNLLKALRPEDLALLSPHLEDRWMARGQTIYNPGDDVSQVYFPCGASVACFLVQLEEGRSVEAALIGREGAIGGVVSEGRLPAYARAEVQAAGVFLRLPTQALERAKAASPAIRGLFSRYADCVLAQVFQSVACNAVHTVEQRAAKWLLAGMDRTGESAISLTQEQLAGMLGVGRSYLTRVLSEMKARGLIETERGMIGIRHRPNLEIASCRCNETFRRHFETVLRGVYPDPGKPEAAPRR